MKATQQSVKLIAKTQSELVKYTNTGPVPFNNEELIIYVARVSSSREDKTEDYKKLLNYLIKHKHWSPFEHASYSFEIKTSRAIGAQLLRHRSFTFQEFSQRYAEVTEIQEVELRKQAEKNRQSSEEVFDPFVQYIVHTPDGDKLTYTVRASKAVELQCKNNFSQYNELLDNDVAKECSRKILPLATSTTIVMTGNVRSWIHFLGLRLDEHAQKEIREIAQRILEILVKELPDFFKDE